MTVDVTVIKQPFLRLFTLITLLALISLANADSLAKPTGKVLLTISGDIELTNSASGAQFDYDMLEDLGFVDKKIATEWTGLDSVFTGVLARDVINLVGAKGTWVRAVAANDYSVNLPLTDLTRFETLLALSENGERMTLRDKGPLWLLYPNDSRPEVADYEIAKRMIWQLKSLQIQ